MIRCPNNDKRSLRGHRSPVPPCNQAMFCVSQRPWTFPLQMPQPFLLSDMTRGPGLDQPTRTAVFQFKLAARELPPE